ncbi:hypothetical protein O3M35_011067 [Rhynocoris fuscipes]|uniref:Uncharacterized protein n=1 Tax=Rhynocoris fuscipes TaxID=488301 RepID=A0AAW1CWU9_9HEMI
MGSQMLKTDISVEIWKLKRRIECIYEEQSRNNSVYYGKELEDDDDDEGGMPVSKGTDESSCFLFTDDDATRV